MLGDNARLGDQERMKLSEVDEELIVLVAFGRTDDEIARQLRIPKNQVLDHIARLLAKLGTRERLEIVLYAYSDPALYKRITTKIADRLRNKTVAVGDAQGPFTLATCPPAMRYGRLTFAHLARCAAAIFRRAEPDFSWGPLLCPLRSPTVLFEQRQQPGQLLV
jgi:DNA-binding CsgD family transcriptional regulator